MRLPFTLTESSVLAVIPARYDSTRFPGKALATLDGHPMIEHVYRRAAAAALVHGTIVATDDERIARAVESFGGAVIMTRRVDTRARSSACRRCLREFFRGVGSSGTSRG